MSSGRKKPHSLQRRTQARFEIKKWNRKSRPTATKCGAKRKHDGQPCQLVALENGRCAIHGGRTPRGDDWHKIRWPKADSPDTERKFAQKLKHHQRAAKQRAARLAGMTPEERARHEYWQKTHRAGAQKARTAEQTRRKQDRAARALLAPGLLERLAEPSEDEPQPPPSIDIFS